MRCKTQQETKHFRKTKDEQHKELEVSEEPFETNTVMHLCVRVEEYKHVHTPFLFTGLDLLSWWNILFACSNRMRCRNVTCLNSIWNEQLWERETMRAPEMRSMRITSTLRTRLNSDSAADDATSFSFIRPYGVSPANTMISEPRRRYGHRQRVMFYENAVASSLPPKSEKIKKSHIKTIQIQSRIAFARVWKK